VLLGDELDAAARHAPHTMALAFGDASWTFAEWNRASLALAARVSTEVAPGARVAVLAHNHPTVALALSAVPRAGRVLSLPNQRLHPAEIAEVLDDIDVALVIGPDDLVDPVIARLNAQGSSPIRWDLPQIDDLLVEVPTGVGPGYRPSVTAGPPRSPHDPAWIIHTSGTTGTPKGVVLTHASLLAGATTALFGRPVGATDTYLYPFPLCHVSAHNVLALHLARRPVVLAERFEAGLFWDLTRRWGATMASLAPTMLAMLLDDPATASVPAGTLRAVGYGASAITPELLTEASVRLGCEFSGGYGMTEASGNAVFLDAAAHRSALGGTAHLLSAAGFPGPLTRVRVTPIPGSEPPTGRAAALEPDATTEVASGEAGQIELAGPQVAAGYWNRPQASADTFGADGWLRTGDLGRLDTDGRLWVTDRLKDLVISGGENVSAREVELVLATHPAVKAVAVVGTPDARWGEVVTAVVVPHPGRSADVDELRAYVRNSMAPFKVPKRIALVAALPQNATGKIDKVALRSTLAHPEAGPVSATASRPTRGRRS
jgi:acyl-CoA synthetase (AMP-forming)/AMP-acid ligase II